MLPSRQEALSYKRSIDRALALNRRGEARSDGLTLRQAMSRLEIEWFARDIHPWDCDRPLTQDERLHLYLEQSLADTEDAIHRLFEMLPQVDVIALRVLDPASKATMIGGTVLRTEIERRSHLSVGMRLRLSGVTFRLFGWRLESQQSEDEDLPAENVFTSPVTSHRERLYSIIQRIPDNTLRRVGLGLEEVLSLALIDQRFEQITQPSA